MGRKFPALLLLIGALSFATAFFHGNLSSYIYVEFLILYSTIVLALATWSYFFGHQKGHIFHFFQIVVYAAFGLTALLYSFRIIHLNNTFAIMTVFFVPLILAAIINYKQINDDFRNGIKRNYFKRGGF